MASIISTMFINKAVNLINDVGHAVGIAAYKGNVFLGMTWAATLLMLFASIVWIYEFFRRRRVEKMSRPGNKEARLWG